MNKRQRKKMLKLRKIKHGIFFMDLVKELKENDTVYLPKGNYCLHEGSLYDFKI